MNKEFITCLEHIIDLEKTVMVQEDLLLAMNQRADKLGLRNHYERPVLKQVQQRQVTDGGFDSYIKSDGKTGALLGAGLGILLPIFFHNSTAGMIGFWFVAIPVCCVAGLLIGKNVAQSKCEEQIPIIAKKEAEESQRAYQRDLEHYDSLVTLDSQRVSNELIVKDNLVQSISELQAQIQETYDALTAFYDAAGIYELYRNIVAVSYFHEYLASGICTELGGPNGAYITFKNEMYNRMKIERLDTIINYLDQLHYDNTMLRGAIEYAGYCLDDVCRKMDAMIGQQKIAIEQGQTIQQQNALSLYNQECQKQRLDYLAWMEYYNTHLK